jgi:hypothetical protein
VPLYTTEEENMTKVYFRVLALGLPLVAILLLVEVFASHKVAPKTWLESVVREIQAELDEERPLRPGQLDIHDIQAGDIVYLVHKVSTDKVLITREPHDENGKCMFDYVWLEIESEYIWKSHCSDFGLVPYTDRTLFAF